VLLANWQQQQDQPLLSDLNAVPGLSQRFSLINKSEHATQLRPVMISTPVFPWEQRHTAAGDHREDLPHISVGSLSIQPV
jgi:hypothetical protein